MGGQSPSGSCVTALSAMIVAFGLHGYQAAGGTRCAEGLSGREFFELMRKHTLEGFFSEPKHGGNRDSIGWKVLGFVG